MQSWLCSIPAKGGQDGGKVPDAVRAQEIMSKEDNYTLVCFGVDFNICEQSPKCHGVWASPCRAFIRYCRTSHTD